MKENKVYVVCAGDAERLELQLLLRASGYLLSGMDAIEYRSVYPDNAYVVDTQAKTLSFMNWASAMEKHSHGLGYIDVQEFKARYFPQKQDIAPPLTLKPVYGRLYYDTGELKYEGYYTPFEHDCNCHYHQGRGIEFFRNGKIYRDGVFCRRGLLCGKEYYPNGVLKFEGRCTDGDDGSYYGPTYPVNGKYYDKKGKLLYEGDFKVERHGSLGYPKVTFPPNYPPLG